MSRFTRESMAAPTSIAILLAWFTTLAYALVTEEYTPLTVVTPVMLLMAGWMFGIQVAGRGGTRERD